MKLTDRTKKQLTISGLGVVCVVLVILIAWQFNTEEPKDVSEQPSSAVSDAVEPGAGILTPSSEVNAKSIDSAASVQSMDTGDSTGTEQSIQAEVKKPSEPSQEAKTDPTKTPDGKTADTVTPGNGTSLSTPKAGNKKDGKIYVPGFGWVEDNGGGGSGTTAEDMYENGNKIGNME